MMHLMRTTVTLDPDVERLVKDAVRRSGRSFKEVLNRALREGLAASSPRQKLDPYRVKARRMSLRAGIDPARLNRLADELDVENSLDKQGRAR
jgi:hypothetical protein